MAKLSIDSNSVFILVASITLIFLTVFIATNFYSEINLKRERSIDPNEARYLEEQEFHDAVRRQTESGFFRSGFFGQR